ncbi:hypothetical protein GOP47_0025115 [Adiantum capillus-veneris]|uniref:RING-type domain-containing protein n=1 Tax=Adiantum capillus-veneris TaxID=13818 RepID=A0A9D4U3J1_ADICA|nr:hypothetical protein GOP47_0025115 [Adiantum capillus-veneris]
MARLGKRQRARRRSIHCKQQHEKDMAVAALHLNMQTVDEAAVQKMAMAAPPAFTTVMKSHEGLKAADAGTMKRMEDVALKKMATADAALRRIGVNDGNTTAATVAPDEEALARLRAMAMRLLERIEDIAEANMVGGQGGLGAWERGLISEAWRLKRKVARLQESKRALKRQVREAQEAAQKHHQELQEKTLCMICHDLPRDTFVLPCLHFLYCFSCLSKHTSSNNSCPSCRRSILGLCKASSLSNP